MTGEEAKQVLEMLKKQGYKEEDLLGSFYLMFVNDQINIEELENLSNALGYRLADDFKKMSPYDQKTKGFERI